MALRKIARQASQDSPYRIELWDYVAEHMADRADISGSAAETARAIAADPRFAQEPMLPDATAVCAMQETILNTAASLPLPKLRGTVKMNAEVFRDDPFQRYTHLANGDEHAQQKVDPRIGWYTNAMVACTYAVDDAGHFACAGIVINDPANDNLAAFVANVAAEASEIVSPRSMLIKQACAKSAIPHRLVEKTSGELADLKELRIRISPILLEATKGAEYAYVDGNLRWFSLVNQGLPIASGKHETSGFGQL